MGEAIEIIDERIRFSDGSFIELSVFALPKPVAGSTHNYKYRLAYVVSDECVMRYDNEARKGDHKHIGRKQFPYHFVDIDTLLYDFYTEVGRMRT
ncbi:toxin-antitoxin system TumE family protein [Brucella sp. IR073]|uniref:toxin-antitoxin system TumE family protein n=1 Tax=unclassified Brucella TaxID=2632610 RepID=UPI003B981B97